MALLKNCRQLLAILIQLLAKFILINKFITCVKKNIFESGFQLLKDEVLIFQKNVRIFFLKPRYFSASLVVTALSIFFGGWSIYVFQATSNTSSFTAVLTILVRIVPVKLRIAFYALPYCSKKKPLSQNNYYRDFFAGWQVFSLPYNCTTN